MPTGKYDRSRLLTTKEKKQRKAVIAKRYRDKHKEKIIEKVKLYKELNRDKVLESKRRYRKENKEKVKEMDRSYYERNKERVDTKRKEWQEKNKEKISKRTKECHKLKSKERVAYTKQWRLNNPGKRNETERNKKVNDPLYKLSGNIRKKISRAFKDKGYNKNSKSCEIIGCSYEQLKYHIESKWESWMNWDNYGRYNGEKKHGWDIDHIIPLATAKTEIDITKLNHYTNLQPLCSYVNRCIKWKYYEVSKE